MNFGEKPAAAIKVVQIAVGDAKCDIRDLELSEGDDIVWCPYCGNPAHGNHLIAWLQKKNTCPVCREHLNPEDYK